MTFPFRIGLAVHSVLWLALILPCPHATAASPEGPWRLSPNIGLPDWFQLSGTHRTRYETLDSQFRAGGQGGDQMLAFRTTVRADLKLEPLSVVGELIDSRQSLADPGTPIDTSMVNTLELLQGYAAIRLEGPIVDGNKSEFRIGRQTIDLGGRRLVARNSYRNTINAFTGAHWQWTFQEGPALQAFYFLPILRQPSDAASLLDNQTEFDDEGFDLQFWGIDLRWPGLPGGLTGEFYILGLHEDDSGRQQTRNRQFYTPGVRWFRAPKKGEWDLDLESVGQFGQVRGSTSPADSKDLDHLAHFHHAEAGYTFDVRWTPRAALLYDYASGDGSPTDHESNRFDSLFGARRFDHGPTGIYGAFARSNISSPGYRLAIQPHPALDLGLTHRLYWLASNTDAWTTSGLRDPRGGSGSCIGHQLEGHVRWDIIPGNVRLEVGGAHLFAGGFVHDAPNADGQGDTTYGYASVEIRF